MDPQRLVDLAQALGLPGGAPGGAAAAHPGGAQAAEAAALDPAARQRLRALTDEAIAKGIFGVPTFECQGRLFWGLDALPMLRAHLEGDPWFDLQWDHAARRVPGVVRPRE